MDLIDVHQSFGGEQRRYQHRSDVLGCEMTFSVYLPPQARSAPVPVLYWLSGLTCDDQNFVTKAGAQGWAAEAGMAIVAPDTSPRGEGVADDPDGAYDFGLGAGFYVNASQAPFAEHYRMYDYVVQELPELLAARLPEVTDRKAISGHSMGGHGALVIALRNPGCYTSVSAFAPICAPSRCPWGEKALAGYLGPEKGAWQEYDASLLVAAQPPSALPIRIDQGQADEFLETQLLPDEFLNAAAAADVKVEYQLHPGYDHSYFFIASFMREHVLFHAAHLKT